MEVSKILAILLELVALVHLERDESYAVELNLTYPFGASRRSPFRKR